MLTQFRKQGEHFMGLAYENISATGANAGACFLYISRVELGPWTERKGLEIKDRG
jgi:hypothetical protein